MLTASCQTPETTIPLNNDNFRTFSLFCFFFIVSLWICRHPCPLLVPIPLANSPRRINNQQNLQGKDMNNVYVLIIHGGHPSMHRLRLPEKLQARLPNINYPPRFNHPSQHNKPKLSLKTLNRTAPLLDTKTK